MSNLMLDSLTCHVAYEPSFTWWFPAAGLVGVVVGFGLSFVLKDWRRVFALVFGSLAVLWVVASTASAWGFYSRAKTAARSSTTPVVQGIVESFTPAPFEGHQDESFTVNGVRFSYSDYVITGGFRQTASHGGPIRAGLPVRIRYQPEVSGNLIVQLEICS
jgi:hypothetical protein